MNADNPLNALHPRMEAYFEEHKMEQAERHAAKCMFGIIVSNVTLRTMLKKRLEADAMEMASTLIGVTEELSRDLAIAYLKGAGGGLASQFRVVEAVHTFTRWVGMVLDEAKVAEKVAAEAIKGAQNAS